jgi:4-hydroxybenzoate polyprenyltransferase
MLICPLFVLSVLTALFALFELTAKTTALAAQLATAAASSGTYGFNAGIELDIDALERQLQAQQTQSIAIGMGGLAHNGGGFVGVDVGIIGNQIGGN